MKLDATQYRAVYTELTTARDAVYRAAEALALDDPARAVLRTVSGHIEELKVAILRRCPDCGSGRNTNDDAA